jgi:hypothetical protein
MIFANVFVLDSFLGRCPTQEWKGRGGGGDGRGQGHQAEPLEGEGASTSSA